MHTPRLISLLAASLATFAVLSCVADDTTPNPALLAPGMARARAPAKFKVRFTTTVGDFTVEATRSWAPLGVDRFYNLVRIGYFKDIGFFRVMPGFMVQFGLHGNPIISRQWKESMIKDDPVKQHNTRGMMTFATGGPNTRDVQFFINFANNSSLDADGFAPFARVTAGMDVVDKIYAVGEEPSQSTIQAEGNAYLRRNFPKLDYIKSATVLE